MDDYSHMTWDDLSPAWRQGYDDGINQRMENPEFKGNPEYDMGYFEGTEDYNDPDITEFGDEYD